MRMYSVPPVLRKTCVFCGYARLPKEEGAYRYTLEQVLGEAAHVVIFTLAPGRESVVWISTTSRQVLQVETMIDAETMLRQVRQR